MTNITNASTPEASKPNPNMFRAPQPDQPADQKPADNKPGFPAETPTSEMALEQQVEYWKAQSRKHESGEKTARSELKGLKAKAADYDKMVEANKTEAERAIDAARAESGARIVKTAVELTQRLVDALPPVTTARRGLVTSRVDDRRREPLSRE